MQSEVNLKKQTNKKTDHLLTDQEQQSGKIYLNELDHIQSA